MTDDNKEDEELFKEQMNKVLSGLKPETDSIVVSGEVNLTGDRFIWRLKLVQRDEGFFMPDSGLVIEEME